MRLKDKKVLVVGLGASGEAAARLCLKKGALVRAADTRPAPAAAEALAQAGASLSLGPHCQEDFAWAELIVLSPGVDCRLPFIRQAVSAGKTVIGEMALAFAFMPCPSIMITGSNGKTTVSTLIAQILQAAGVRVFAGGNLGIPLSQLILDEQTPDWAVVEVSSFQTDSSRNLKPKVGIILSLLPNHLDRYDSFADYAASKFTMLHNQTGDDLAILCADDPEVAARLSQAPAQVLAYGSKAPAQSGAAWLEGQSLLIRLPGRPAVTIQVAGQRLVGAFNQLNLLAAAAACLYAGVEAAVIGRAIREFNGLPHRLVKAGQMNGVNFYDDSKATNVGAVQAALEALPEKSVLLLGGRDKAGNFKELKPQLERKAVQVVCFGEAGPLIYEQLQNIFPCKLAGDLKSALQAACRLAEPGQAVLLSPGCASFDAYSGYAERGEHFTRLVKELAN